MRGDDRRQSRPSVIFWTPASAKYAPMARPRSATKSSGESRSAMPRMSYSRKTLGFIGGLSQEIATASLLGRFNYFSYILRAVPRDDQNRVARRHDDQVAHADDADERGAFLGDDDAAVAVDQRRSAQDDVAARVCRTHGGPRRPAAH